MPLPQVRAPTVVNTYWLWSKRSHSRFRSLAIAGGILPPMWFRPRYSSSIVLSDSHTAGLCGSVPPRPFSFRSMRTTCHQGSGNTDSEPIRPSEEKLGELTHWTSSVKQSSNCSTPYLAGFVCRHSLPIRDRSLRAPQRVLLPTIAVQRMKQNL